MTIKNLLKIHIILLPLVSSHKAIGGDVEECAKTDSLLQFIQGKISSQKVPVDMAYKVTEETRQLLDVTNQSKKAQNFLNALLLNKFKTFNFTPKYSPEYKQILADQRDNLMLDVVSDMVTKNKRLRKKKDTDIILSKNEIADLSLLDNKGICDNVTQHITSVLDKYTFWARMITPTNNKTEILKNRDIIKVLVKNPNIIKALLKNREEQRQYEDFLILFHENARCFERLCFNVNYDLSTFVDAVKHTSSTVKYDKTGTPCYQQYSFNGDLVNMISTEHFNPYDNINPIYLLVRKVCSGIVKKTLIQSRLTLIGFPLSLSLGALALRFLFRELNWCTCIARGVVTRLIIFLSLRTILANQVGWKIFNKYKMGLLYIVGWVGYLAIFGLRWIKRIMNLLGKSMTLSEILKNFPIGLGGNTLDMFSVIPPLLCVIGVFWVLLSIGRISFPVTYGQREFYRKLFFTHIKDNVMKNIRGYVSNMKNFYNRIKKTSSLFKLLNPLLASNNHIFATEYQSNSALSDEQRHMFMLMNKEDLSEDDMVVFLHLFDHNRGLFNEAIQEQAYISTYLYSAERVLSGRYCIADFIDSQDQYISLQDARHVMLGEKAVSNDVELGSNSANGFRNWIFNGMNATGKTVMMETIIDAVVIAQGVGIAPCKQYEATIFDNIFTAFGASTDIQSNYSKFMSELKQIDNLIQFCKKHKNKKIIIGCDEICSGTDPETAESLVYNVFVELMQNQNMSLLAATHYQLPRQIEKDHPKLKCGNHMMKVSHNNAGDLVFLRKLARGFPKQSLAVHITNEMVKKKIIQPIFNELISKKQKIKKGGICC